MKDRRYALYFAGQTLSMTGTFTQQMVQSWLVYKLTNSSMWLGLIAFLGQFPAFMMSPIAGVVADHFNRKQLLKVVLVVQMIQASLLAILTLSGNIHIWHIAVLAAVLGLTNAFELTSRHSLAVDLAGRDKLVSAIALNAFIINGAKFAGPSLGGVLVVVMGEGWCFLLNAFSYIAILFSLRGVQSKYEPTEKNWHLWTPLRDGFRYVKARPELRTPILFTGFLGLVGAPYIVLLPVFSRDYLHGDARLLGWLMAAHSIGALLGALFGVSKEEENPNLSRRILSRLFVFSIAVLIFALSRSPLLSATALFFCGFVLVSTYPIINAHIQAHVSEHMRGRVISIYTMMFLATLPIGGFLSGWIAERIQAPLTIGIVGMSTFVVSCFLRFYYLGRRQKAVKNAA